jgi:hypothetical protein
MHLSLQLKAGPSGHQPTLILSIADTTLEFFTAMAVVRRIDRFNDFLSSSSTISMRLNLKPGPLRKATMAV